MLAVSPTPSESGAAGVIQSSRESLFDSASDRGMMSKTPSPSRSDVSACSGTGRKIRVKGGGSKHPTSDDIQV